MIWCTYTPGDQIPHAALSRMNFDLDEFGNERVCFAINDIYFAASVFGDTSKNQNRTQNKQNFPGQIEKNQKRQLETILRSSKKIRTTQRCTSIYHEIILRGVVPFIPPKPRHLILLKARKTHPGKNATEAPARMVAGWPGITNGIQQFEIYVRIVK